MEKITLCGDNCSKCPRYLAKTDSELTKVAELWYRVGWRDKIVSNDEIRCNGCSSHKKCTYQLVECIKENRVERCNQCQHFQCEKIRTMLARSAAYKETCRNLCTKEEFEMLEAAFFNKEENIRFII